MTAPRSEAGNRLNRSEIVTRPAVRWHGGKYLLAPWIVDHLPQHRVYVEPFGGAASVLLRKKRSYAEVYNDLDDEIVNLFRVLQDDTLSHRLRIRLVLTLFSRREYELAREYAERPADLCQIPAWMVDNAWRLVVRSFMGFGSDAPNREVSTGFRASANRAGTTPAHDWMNYPVALEQIVKRFRGVVIENRPAVKVMASHDKPTTLHYVDPPYLPETRSPKSRKSGARYHAYRHEMTVEDHEKLLSFLRTLRGMVVLSGYPSKLYDEALAGWQRFERRSLADGARERTEVLWLNPHAASQVTPRHTPSLFEGAPDAAS